MRRKIFTVLFVLATTIETMFAVTIDGITYELDYVKSTATVTSGVKYSGNIVIPFFVEYNDKAYTVMGIGYRAFEGCKNLTSVEIPNGVTSIGSYAFRSCDKLVTVTFKYGYNLTKIGERAFENCTSLTSIAIPSSVESIGERAFENCTSLTSIAIPSSVESIGNRAFDGCNGLTSITIPNNVTHIGNFAFSQCSSLQSVMIGSSVISIGNGAFSGCTGLTTINWNATDYPSPSYPTEAPFYSIRAQITSFTFGHKVKTIPEDICYGMTNLTAISIPSSVTSIGDYAFYSCDKLTTIVWNAKNCKAYNFGSQVESFTFGNSVEVIPDGLCSGMSKLTSIEIPDGVTSIGDGVFYGCTGLTSPVYIKRIFAYMPSSYSGAYAIPDGIESIAGSAFSGCTGLTSVTIPNSVTSIGGWAFADCTGLTSVTIPNSVTSIGGSAFSGCTSLTSVTIPNSVTSIGNDAFENCRGLTSVTNFANTPQEIAWTVFYNVDKSTCVLYVPAGSISAYQSDYVWKGFTNILPIGAQPADVTTTIVTPSATTADIAWPQVTGADTYTIDIKKNGELICTLTFNAQGQLTSIAFNAPSRNNAPQQAQAAGFSFTVTSLDSGTTYSYTMTAKGNNGNVLKTESGSFTTTGDAQGVEEVLSNQVPSTKILRNGQIFILRGDKIYNAQGALVK